MVNRVSNVVKKEEDFDSFGLEKGQTVYWARVLENIGYFEIFELKIRTVDSDYFVGCDKDTKLAYMFNYPDLNEIIFTDRLEALNKINAFKEKFSKLHPRWHITIDEEED